MRVLQRHTKSFKYLVAITCDELKTTIDPRDLWEALDAFGYPYTVAETVITVFGPSRVLELEVLGGTLYDNNRPDSVKTTLQ